MNPFFIICMIKHVQSVYATKPIKLFYHVVILFVKNVLWDCGNKMKMNQLSALFAEG